MNQTVQMETSDLKCKIEALRSEIRAAKTLTSQHTISNAEVAKCVFDLLCTIVENLSCLKVSCSQARHGDSNEGTSSITTINERHQHVSKDDVEMIS